MMCDEKFIVISSFKFIGYFNMNTRRHNPFDCAQINNAVFADRTHPDCICLARRNLNELTKLINRLFERYSRLLVLRIDLRYKKDVALAVPLEIAQMHRAKLLADRRSYPEVFDGMLGYAWGLEFGEQEGGFHYHFLAIYNGAERRDDVGIGMAIGNLWDEITGGYGQCYISNFDKDRLAKQGCLGIGMIHRDDVQSRINLNEKVAAYITKKCSALDIKSGSTQSGEFRTFGKSRMPEPVDENSPRRGRPPVKGN